MKTTLEFDNRSEAITAIKGPDYHSCLWDLDQDLRNKLKHGHKMKDADEVMEYVRDFINNNIDLNEVE